MFLLEDLLKTPFGTLFEHFCAKVSKRGGEGLLIRVGLWIGKIFKS